MFIFPYTMKPSTIFLSTVTFHLLLLFTDRQASDPTNNLKSTIDEQLNRAVKHFLGILQTHEDIYRILLRDLLRVSPAYRLKLVQNPTSLDPAFDYFAYLLSINRPEGEEAKSLLALVQVDTGPLAPLSEERIYDYKSSIASLLEPIIIQFDLESTIDSPDAYEQFLVKLQQEIHSFATQGPDKYSNREQILASMVSIAFPRMMVELKKDQSVDMSDTDSVASDVSDSQLAKAASSGIFGHVISSETLSKLAFAFFLGLFVSVSGITNWVKQEVHILWKCSSVNSTDPRCPYYNRKKTTTTPYNLPATPLDAIIVAAVGIVAIFLGIVVIAAWVTIRNDGPLDEDQENTEFASASESTRNCSASARKRKRKRYSKKGKMTKK